MRIAYADPPYLGCCSRYGHKHGQDGRCWDSPLTHAALITRLLMEFPDGWALSLSAREVAERARGLMLKAMREIERIEGVMAAIASDMRRQGQPAEQVRQKEQE